MLLARGIGEDHRQRLHAAGRRAGKIGYRRNEGRNIQDNRTADELQARRVIGEAGANGEA